MKDLLIKLDEEHGPLVRIVPNTVSVGEAASVKTIYTGKAISKKGRLAMLRSSKSDAYGAANILIKGTAIGSLKRAIGTAFITRNLLDYEPDVDMMLEALQRRLLREPTCILFPVLKLVQLDFLFKANFSEVPGCLEIGMPPEVQDFITVNMERGTHWVRWTPFPDLEVSLSKPGMGPFPAEGLGVAGVGQPSRAQGTAGSERKVDHLQRFLDASEKHPDVVHPGTVSSLMYSTMSAGGDTTAAAATAVVTHLVRNPDKYSKFMAELDEAKAADAVMKESLRVSPVLPILLEQVVPPEGAVLAGVPIPGGTVLGCMPAVVTLDKSCWGDDIHTFRPGRWLSDDRKTRLAMEKGFLAFWCG